MFDMDVGGSGGEGPWIAWSARGTQDGSVPPKSFYLREGSDKTPLAAFGTGVVLDIETMRTGWQKSEGIAGVAPEWRWNASLSRFEAAPGEDWKRGFSIRCAIGSGKTATWEQAGAAAWNAFTALVPDLKGQPAPGMLPLVKMTATKAVQFKRGSTVEPVLTIAKWVPKPDCLKEGAAAGIATEPAPVQQQAQQAAAQVAAAVAQPAMADDDLEF